MTGPAGDPMNKQPETWCPACKGATGYYPYGGRNWVKCRTCNGTGEQPTVTYQTPGARSAAQVRHWKLMHHVTGEDFQPCADCLPYYGVTE